MFELDKWILNNYLHDHPNALWIMLLQGLSRTGSESLRAGMLDQISDLVWNTEILFNDDGSLNLRNDTDEFELHARFLGALLTFLIIY